MIYDQRDAVAPQKTYKKTVLNEVNLMKQTPFLLVKLICIKFEGNTLLWQGP